MSEATIQNADVAAAPTKYRRFKVDLWATNLNDVELGVMRGMRHRAKSDQFTTDMDVIGQVTEEGERTGIVAYRKQLWREETGAKRRLVIKLFSSSMNWRGTMDMMMGRSLQLTHGAAGKPMPAFSINLARHEQIIQLERSADAFWFSPEKYSFFILDDEGSKFYSLRQNLLSIGSDYSLFDQQNRKIGLLDGKVISLGGLWKARLRKEHANARLASVLQLFCAMLKFRRDARGQVRGVAGDMRKGVQPLHLDRHEKDIYGNPRAR